MCVEVTGVGHELREAGGAGMLVFAKNLGFSFSERKTPPEHFELRSHDRISLTHSYPEVCLWLKTQMSSFGGRHRPFCALSSASWQVGGCRERFSLSTCCRSRCLRPTPTPHLPDTVPLTGPHSGSPSVRKGVGITAILFSLLLF